MEIVVVEAERVGFGASSRNGGFVSGLLAGNERRWVAATSKERVSDQRRAIRATVDEIGAVVKREGINCGFLKSGTLWVARTPLELERLHETAAADRGWGQSAHDLELLDAAQTTERLAFAGALGAVFDPHAARVQPAQLTHGLAEAAERAGVKIHEGSFVSEITSGKAVISNGASVRASIVVRATEGYTPQVARLRRTVLPIHSTMIVTAPLAPWIWGEIGWAGAETLVDGRRYYFYAQRTSDDRIAIGGAGVGRLYSLGSRIDWDATVSDEMATQLRNQLVAAFPLLAGVAIDSAWEGILGITRDWAPAVGLDRRAGLAWAGGYAGEGVAASNLAGRTLRDLILGEDTDLTHLPWVGPIRRAWEVEPLRYLGVRTVARLSLAADRRENHTLQPALAGKLADAIAGQS
jgi:glycine/D-amino acid oxidase-like deaminating enzyme